MKSPGAQFSLRIFSGILIAAGILLVALISDDYHAQVAVKNLTEKYFQIDHLRNDMVQFNEIISKSSQMAMATGDLRWEKRYEHYESLLNNTLQEAIKDSPSIFRKNIFTHRKEDQVFVILGRLNTLLKEQMEAALKVEQSKEYIAQVSLISVLCLLLLSWVMILRLSRQARENLLESNRQLEERTRQLDELNQTLELKVLGRTHSLKRTLEHLENTHQALKDAQNQLLQSEKFSAIGELSAGIAHEINNPIGFISSNLQTLKLYVDHYKQLLKILNKLELALKDNDLHSATEVAHSWQKIRQEINFSFIDGDITNLLNESIEGADKIAKIVRDLKTFASPDKGKIDPVNLEVLMESILNIVWNEIKYKAEVKREYGQVPMVYCNAQKMGQVFVNILINAAQAIKGKGIITIKTYVEKESVLVAVKDTGCGIDPEHLKHIFDPFFTTKPPGEGVGLGLSLSYDIVRKHGGDLSFDSKLNEGATFTVALPLMPSDVKQFCAEETL